MHKDIGYLQKTTVTWQESEQQISKTELCQPKFRISEDMRWASSRNSPSYGINFIVGV